MIFRQPSLPLKSPSASRGDFFLLLLLRR